MEHNTQAEWLKEIKGEMTRLNHRQEDIEIDEAILKEQLMRIPNWKAQGPDGLQGFWIKNLFGIHSRLAEKLNEDIRTGVVPTCMTTGRTILCIKDISRGNAAGNYRPMSCLPVMWKVLTGIAEIYAYMENRDLFAVEQMGCKKKARDTNISYLLTRPLSIIQNEGIHISLSHGLTIVKRTIWYHTHGY